MFRLAAGRSLPGYVSIGKREPGSSVESVEEVIGASAVSGAPLHIVHINSSCASQALDCLSLVAGARASGLDVTTEAYPYEAGMTYVNSALFNPAWQEKFEVTYHA
jgi:dihydroorotase-like cyclic amidohydrolase